MNQWGQLFLGEVCVKETLCRRICSLFVQRGCPLLFEMQKIVVLFMVLEFVEVLPQSLIFADDCFLFFKAEANQTQIMKDIFTTYEAASGQAISLPKFEIYCSQNVSDSMKFTITNMLGVQSDLGTRKYLGLPSMIGRDRNATFSYIKDKVGI